MSSRVNIKCPRCEELNSFFSDLSWEGSKDQKYSMLSAPTGILADLVGQSVECKCGVTYGIKQVVEYQAQIVEPQAKP